MLIILINKNMNLLRNPYFGTLIIIKLMIYKFCIDLKNTKTVIKRPF